MYSARNDKGMTRLQKWEGRGLRPNKMVLGAVVSPSWASLRPGEAAESEMRTDFRELPGFRHAKTFGDARMLSCVIESRIRKR